ncbi:MAG: hypothetical protein JXA50_03550 [Deltaproteobacteria bacterium]|nr:hypothetical protein [Deltaproteobacteria bacterium]
MSGKRGGGGAMDRDHRYPILEGPLDEVKADRMAFLITDMEIRIPFAEHYDLTLV